MTKKEIIKTSADSEEILKDPEFAHAIKTLAMDFGADCTLKELKLQIDYRKPQPTKTISGINYLGGYSGPYMIEKGWRYLTLVDISETKTDVKIMFADKSDRFIYHNIPKNDMSITLLVNAARLIGKEVYCNIFHGVIEKTGEYHASVAEVKWDNVKGEAEAV